MRLSACLLLASLAGVVGGAFLVARWAVGCAIIFDSVCAGCWALLRDDERPAPSVREVPVTLASVLERARNAS